MIDVQIIGGGPAGCFAGISAQLSGKNALLCEEHAKIGEPEACSGLISKSGLESLSGYVDYRKARINDITSARIISGKQEFSIRPKKESAVLVSRSEFDSLAAERFEREGGKLSLGKRVALDFACRSIIGADGPASAVAERFGFPKIRSFVAAMQGDFRFGCDDAHCTCIYLSPQDFPGFFGWVIPKNEEEAKIGIGVSLPNHPLKYYRRFLSQLGVEGKPSNEFAAVIPAETRKKTALRKNGCSVLLAGDAAGQVKATTGGGVFFGASCGEVAGRLAGEPERYEEEWRRKYALDLAFHSALRRVLNFGGGAPHPLLLSSAKALLFEDLLSEEGRMDRLGGMLSPSLLFSYAGIVGKRAGAPRPEAKLGGFGRAAGRMAKK